MSTESNAPREHSDRTPEDTLRRTVEDCRIIELPERKEGVKQFLRKATKVANRNKRLMKVIDSGVCVFVILPVGLDEAMDGLTQLIGMAVQIFTELLPYRDINASYDGKLACTAYGSYFAVAPAAALKLLSRRRRALRYCLLVRTHSTLPTLRWSKTSSTPILLLHRMASASGTVGECLLEDCLLSGGTGHCGALPQRCFCAGRRRNGWRKTTRTPHQP